MQLSKRGNSLAIRVPATVVRALGLREAELVDLCAVDDANVAVISERQRRQAALDRFEKLAVSFPTGYRFDRDEADAR